jgi:hypothetical protein
MDRSGTNELNSGERQTDQTIATGVWNLLSRPWARNLERP